MKNTLSASNKWSDWFEQYLLSCVFFQPCPFHAQCLWLECWSGLWLLILYSACSAQKCQLSAIESSAVSQHRASAHSWHRDREQVVRTDTKGFTWLSADPLGHATFRCGLLPNAQPLWHSMWCISICFTHGSNILWVFVGTIHTEIVCVQKICARMRTCVWVTVCESV